MDLGAPYLSSMYAAMEHALVIPLIPFFLDFALKQIRFDPLLLAINKIFLCYFSLST